MERKEIAMKAARIWLALVYGFGALGLAWSTSQLLFLALTPFTLLGGALVLLYFEKEKRFKTWLVLALSWMAGYAVEVLGVKTGAIFGAYGYGSVLGLQMAGVPLVIGLNWTILLYAIYMVFKGTRFPSWSKPILGAMLLVFTDVWIEPVAVKLGFWTWESPNAHWLFVAPLQNYLAWGLFSLFILSIFQLLQMRWQNPLAIRYWIYQLLFFMLLNLLLT
jgi:putative membrane protein